MPRLRFILIGGFLGAGKTTTLARLARHYAGRGQRVSLVTNDQAVQAVEIGQRLAAASALSDDLSDAQARLRTASTWSTKRVGCGRPTRGTGAYRRGRQPCGSWAAASPPPRRKTPAAWRG